MRRHPALLVLLLAGLFTVFGAGVSAQVTDRDAQARESGFSLGQNYPNPFNPETRIPFTLGESLFADGGSVRVSIRIFNVLRQFVATPAALSHPNGEVPVLDLEYTQPGEYLAWWDGKGLSGRSVASGMYFMQLKVGDRVQVRRMYVAK